MNRRYKHVSSRKAGVADDVNEASRWREAYVPGVCKAVTDFQLDKTGYDNKQASILVKQASTSMKQAAKVLTAILDS